MRWRHSRTCDGKLKRSSAVHATYLFALFRHLGAAATACGPVPAKLSPSCNAIGKAPRAAGYRGSDFVLWL
jgi:hypothetical protein